VAGFVETTAGLVLALGLPTPLAAAASLSVMIVRPSPSTCSTAARWRSPGGVLDVLLGLVAADERQGMAAVTVAVLGAIVQLLPSATTSA
jgi:hypothetical protein